MTEISEADVLSMAYGGDDVATCAYALMYARIDKIFTPKFVKNVVLVDQYSKIIPELLIAEVTTENNQYQQEIQQFQVSKMMKTV